MLLELQEIAVNYQKISALKGVSLQVAEQQFVTLIGANGAGKSSVLRTISGLVRPAAGKIVYQGTAIENWSPDKIVGAGIAHVPEGRRVFPDLTVYENLYMGAYILKDKSLINRSMSRVFGYFPVLKERTAQLAKTMSGGEQQMLSIGRALMNNPKLLLLDEPSLGLAPRIVQNIVEILINLNKEEQLSIILVEQNAEIALRISDYGYVMETGKIVLADQSKNLHNSDYVKKAYLGL